MDARPTRKHPDIFAGDPCARCGGPTRLTSIAPHKRRKRSHVWTFECTVCGAVERLEMPIPRRPH